MEKRITARREVLAELREDFSLCGKCKLCQAVMAQQCDDPRFWRNCPSGTRFRYEAYYASGKMEIARCLEIAEIEPDEKMKHVLYTCMLCGSCEDRCYPVKQLHPLWVIELLREQAVEDGWAPLEWFSDIYENLEKTGNPYGVPPEKRLEWAEGMDIKSAIEEECEYLLFVGDDYQCFPSLTPKIQSIVRALKLAGIDFGILGEEEVSSGSALLLIGDRDRFEEFAARNIENINKAGITKVITPDPHAYTVLKEEYTKACDIEVYHLSEIVSALISKEKIKPTGSVKMKAVYHDPCRLGRRHGKFEEPRIILRSIPELELLEFPRSRKNSLCCGGGGSVFFIEPEFASWVAKERIFEAEYIGAEAIITACPICGRMLTDAIKETQKDIAVYNLGEVLEKSLTGGHLNEK